MIYKLKDVDSKFLGTNSDITWQIVQSTPLFYIEGSNKILTVEEELELVKTNSKLTEKFIRKYQDELDWVDISEYQTLSESFIREFKNEVYWYLRISNTLSR